MGCGSSAVAITTASALAATNKNANIKNGRHRRQALWSELKRRLPTGADLKSQVDRDEKFEAFDTKHAGFLDETAIVAGCRDVLKLQEVCGPRGTDVIVKLAFLGARMADKTTKHIGRGQINADDVIQRSEFRAFLAYVRDYFELWAMFDEVDSSEDATIGFEEFEAAVPLIQDWGLKVADTRDAFKRMDIDGSHSISFVEFADWAIRHRLEYDGDDDDVVPNPLAPSLIDPSFAELRTARLFNLKKANEAVALFLKHVGRIDGVVDSLLEAHLQSIGKFEPAALSVRGLSNALASDGKKSSNHRRDGLDRLTEKLRTKLPMLFRSFSACEREKLTLSEVQHGCIDTLRFHELLPCSPEVLLTQAAGKAKKMKHHPCHAAALVIIEKAFVIGTLAVKRSNLGRGMETDNAVDLSGFGYTLLALHDILQVLSLFEVVLDADGAGGICANMPYLTYDELARGKEVLEGWMNRDVALVGEEPLQHFGASVNRAQSPAAQTRSASPGAGGTRSRPPDESAADTFAQSVNQRLGGAEESAMTASVRGGKHRTLLVTDLFKRPGARGNPAEHPAAAAVPLAPTFMEWFSSFRLNDKEDGTVLYMPAFGADGGAASSSILGKSTKRQQVGGIVSMDS